MAELFKPLFAPNLHLKSRLIMPPMATYKLLTTGGYVSDDLLSYYDEKPKVAISAQPSLNTAILHRKVKPVRDNCLLPMTTPLTVSANLPRLFTTTAARPSCKSTIPAVWPKEITGLSR